MLHFTQGVIPEYIFHTAIQKPVPVRCVQVAEDFAVETPEGLQQAKAGDYLILNAKGDLHPCPKETFEAGYDII